jgi:pimeloyl-ACP methyl ester carboxylesterase
MTPTNGSARPPRRDEPSTISLLGVDRAPVALGVEEIAIRTDRGNITGYFHPAGPDATPGAAAVIWVGGAGGGIEGPASGLYRILAERLVPQEISSLRLHYRHPNVLRDCITDVLVALAWLEDIGGVRRAVLVGHSFGGAVVIDAGALSPIVKGVIALASQTYGADLVGELSPRSLLLVHGDADSVLPDTCSRRLYAAARDPRHLVIYPGAGHGLDECAPALYALVHDYIVRELAPLGG